MKVTIRQFQTNSSKYLSNLPITLTRYKKPIAKIIPFGTKTIKPKKQTKTKDIFCEKCKRKIGKDECLSKNKDNQWVCTKCKYL